MQKHITHDIHILSAAPFVGVSAGFNSHTVNYIFLIIYLDLEAMMNSFISLILFCTFDDKLTRKFCSKLTEMGASENNALLRIKM